MGKNKLILVLICLAVLLIASCGNETQGPLHVSLDEEFVLHESQYAVIENEDLEIGITEFFNSPPPDGVEAFWSGVGIAFEYRHAGDVQKGINLVQAFGYQTTIIDTDHETFARLKLIKLP
jgi:hypothetical protein